MASNKQVADEKTLLSDFLDATNPLLIPVSGLSRVGRTTSPTRSRVSPSKHRKPLSIRQTRSRPVSDQYDEDEEDGMDFRTMRMGELEASYNDTAHQSRPTRRGKTSFASTSGRDAGAVQGMKLAGGRVMYHPYPGATTKRPGSVHLSSAGSGDDDSRSMFGQGIDRPSTARHSMGSAAHDGARLMSMRTKSARVNKKQAESTAVQSSAFRAQGHAEGRSFMTVSTGENPGPGHYNCKYSLRERRVVDTRIDLMGAPAAGRFAINQPADAQPPGSRSPRQASPVKQMVAPIHYDAEGNLQGLGTPHEHMSTSPEDAEVQSSRGGAPQLELPGSIEKSFDNAHSPMISPTSPTKLNTLKGATAGRDLLTSRFMGSVAFTAPPRADPTDIALRSSAASHLVPYDVDTGIAVVKKRTVAQISDFNRMISRETAQKVMPSGSVAPPVGTYTAPINENYAAWRQMKASIPRAAGSPVVALTRAGIRRVFAAAATGTDVDLPPVDAPASLARTASGPETTMSNAGLTQEDPFWYLDGGVYRRRKMAPGRVERGVLRTMQRVLLQKERDHLEAAAALQNELLPPTDHHLPPPSVPTPIPEATEEELEESASAPVVMQEEEEGDGYTHATVYAEEEPQAAAEEEEGHALPEPQAHSPAAEPETVPAPAEPEPQPEETTEAEPVVAAGDREAEEEPRVSAEPAAPEPAPETQDGEPEACTTDAANEPEPEAQEAPADAEAEERDQPEEAAAAEGEVAEDARPPSAHAQEEGEEVPAGREAEAEEAPQQAEEETPPAAEVEVEEQPPQEPEPVAEPEPEAPSAPVEETQEEAPAFVPIVPTGSIEASVPFKPAVAVEDSEDIKLDVGELPELKKPGRNVSKVIAGGRSQRFTAPTAHVDVTFPALDVGLAQAPLTVDVARLRSQASADERVEEGMGRLSLKRTNVSQGGASFSSGMTLTGVSPFQVRKSSNAPSVREMQQGPTQTHPAFPTGGRFLQEPLDFRDNLFPKKHGSAVVTGPKGSKKEKQAIATATRPTLRLTNAEMKEMQIHAGPIKSTLKIEFSGTAGAWSTASLPTAD